MGFNTLILSTFIEGEARHVGSVFAGIARELAASSRPVPPPAALLAGGETTVTVTGPGRGGRNQELVLQASKRLAMVGKSGHSSKGSEAISCSLPVQVDRSGVGLVWMLSIGPSMFMLRGTSAPVCYVCFRNCAKTSTPICRKR